MTFTREMGRQKLGQPVPASNFVHESNKAVSQHHAPVVDVLLRDLNGVDPIRVER